jgi:hypothetical protein
MDPSRRRQIASAHAKHESYCSCGRIVHGNGGRHNHREMHERAGDGHRYVTRAYFDKLFPGWGELPTIRERVARKVPGPREDA